MLLENGHGVEGVLLLELGLELLEDGRQVGHVLLGLGPLMLGQELVLQAELGRAADPVNAVVALLGRQPAERLEDRLVLLEDQVIGPVVFFWVALVQLPHATAVLEAIGVGRGRKTTG